MKTVNIIRKDPALNILIVKVVAMPYYLGHQPFLLLSTSTLF